MTQAIKSFNNDTFRNFSPQENNLTLPYWMKNVVRPLNSFEFEINHKISPYPHYPGPIHNIGGLYYGNSCRIPGVQPFLQTILQPNKCFSHQTTNFCFEYGNAKFPPKCKCNEKYYCSTKTCELSTFGESRHDRGVELTRCCNNGNCSSTCGSCNHNSNVIFY